MFSFSPTISLLCFLMLAISHARAEDTQAAIRILRDDCLTCHKPGKAKGGLLLHTYEKMMVGGDSGEVILPGKAAESLLYQVLSEDGDPHMPPKKQLSQESIETLARWINDGASWDATVFDEAPVPRPVALTPPPASYQSALALALAPDGNQLAVAKSNRIELLDLTKPERYLAATLEGHIEPIQSLIWTPDGKGIITGGSQRIFVWDVAEKKATKRFTESLLGDITCLAVSKDGETLFVADSATGGAGFIHQFHLPTAKHTATWKAHDDTIYSLEISLDGQQILSCGADSIVKLWDAKTRQSIATFEGHTNHVLAATFNHDGTQIASAGADREIKLWDIKSGEQIVSLGDEKSVYTALDWTGAGNALVVTTDKGAATVYSEFKAHDGAQSSAGTKERTLTAVTETLTAVASSADGNFIYAGSFDGNVHVWDSKSGVSTPVAWVKEPASEPPTSASASETPAPVPAQ
jgi:WD40 repeat protein